MKLGQHVDKFGIAGVFLVAFFSPCCFPLVALVLSAFGIGSFELFGEWTMWIFQAMVLLALIGLFISYRKHRCLYPLLIAVPGALLIFFSYHFIDAEYWIYLMYAGMMALLVATIVNYRRNKLHGSCSSCKIIDGKEVELSSRIKCPDCGYEKDEMMPEDSCQYFYECEKCKTVLKPKKGDCCVFCSYGTVPCPPIQLEKNCC